MDIWDDEDDGIGGLGIDIFAAIQEAVKSKNVQQQFSTLKNPITGVLPQVSGGPKLPSWLTQLGKPIATLVKTTVEKAKVQPTTAPATSSTGEPLVPSAGGVGKPASSLPGGIPMSYLYIGMGLVGIGVYLNMRRRNR
jgi:hypothetical protein